MATPVTSPMLRKQYKSIWSIPSFTILLVTSILLNIGNKLYELVLPLMIYEMTHSSVALSSMRTAELLPNFLFAIWIGAMVDRVHKKKWVIWMIAVQTVLLLMFAALNMYGVHLLLLYYTLGFLLMTFNYGYFNAQISLTKSSVPHEYLTASNAKFSFVETFIGIMGPALSAFVLMLAHLYDGVLLTAFAYGLCLILLFNLPTTETIGSKGQQAKTRIWSDLREGWMVFRSNQLFFRLTCFVVLLNSTSIVIQSTIIFYTKDQMHLSSSLVAILLSCTGVGGLIGSLVIRKLRDKIALGTLFGCTAILNAVSYALLFLTHTIPLLLTALLLFGFAASLYNISVYTVRQEQTPPEFMGRISGITGMLFRIGMPVTMYASGWMILWWGASSVFISASIFNLVVFIVYVKSSLWKAF